MRKKIFLSSFIVFCIAVLVTALGSWHVEKLDTFIRVKIASFSKKNLPVYIFPGRTEIQLLPFRLTVNDIQITPQKDLSEKVKPLHIKQVTVSPSFLHLFIGKLHLSSLTVDGTQLELHFPLESDGPEIQIQLDKILRSIPISQIKIEHVDLSLKLSGKEESYAIKANDISALATNDVSSLALKLKTSKASVNRDDMSLVKDIGLETHFFLTSKNLILSELKIKEGNSFVLASGSTQHNLLKKTLRSANMNVRVQVDAARARTAYDLIKKPEEPNPLSEINGTLRADAQIKSTDAKNISAWVGANIDDLQIAKFKVGDIQLNGEFQSESQNVTVKKATIKTPGIEGEVENLKTNLKELTFSDAKVLLKKFELYKFLDFALNSKIPADARITASLTCSGNFKEFNISCPGSAMGENLFVNTSKKDPIISIPKAWVEGSVNVNAKEVSYKAQLRTEKSRGSSQGVINYENGFNIQYDASHLDLDEIKKISVLELKGSGTASGSTQGNSDSAVFTIDFDGKGLEMQKYQLGDASLTLSYKSGHLFANKLQGSLVSSRYLGQLDVDLNDNTITGKVQFPFIDLAVVKEAIKANLDIPVVLAGSGAAVVNLDSPLNPDKLSFTAKARLYNCMIEGQHFDTADADISSTLGQVKLNSVVLEEKNSNLVFTGGLDLEKKTYAVLFKSQRYYLDDFYAMKFINTPSKGTFALDGTINGPFNNPAVDGKFSSGNFSIAGQSLSPINGAMQFHSSKKIINVTGPKDLKLSYKDLASSPDMQIEANMNQFNLAPLLTSLMGTKQLDDYVISTSSNLNLRINKKDYSKVNGYIHVPTISLQFQKTELKNEKEISLFLTQGKLNFSTFILSGKTGKLEFKSSANSVSPIDLQISGLFSLSFAHIFAPFLETIEGLASVNLRMRGDYNKIHFIGSSFIDDGFIKLAEIQHAFEDVKVDVLFNQDQLVINSIKGKFASGQVVGDGKVLIKGKKDLPVNINLHLSNIDLNLPAGVNTKGNADVQLTGKWLPFTLAGTYQVYDGLVSKELGGGEASTVNPHEVFLPATLREETLSPILLDMNIVPTSPLKVKNSIIDGRVAGSLKVTGNPASPTLGGNFTLTKNSQVIFMDIVFKVRDSSFVLNNTTPPNPGLYLVAETRYRGYDIELLLQGTAEKPRFKWSSSPSLTEPEIISLLTLGTTTSTQISNTTTNTSPTAPTTTTTNNSDLGSQNSQQQGGAAIFSQNPLSKELKNRFGFDIQFSSRFDTANNVAVPKVSIAKQLNERTSLIGSYQTGRDAQSNYTVQYQLNRDFSTSANIQTLRQDDPGVTNNNLRQNEILGIDFNFRKEFK